MEQDPQTVPYFCSSKTRLLTERLSVMQVVTRVLFTPKSGFDL